MLKKIFFTCLIVFLTGYASFGQNAYYEGYVVKAEGDTTYGWIRYRSLNFKGEYIDFKKTTRDDPKKILKDDILSFSHSNGRMFKPVDLGSISEYQTTIIVEILVKGMFSLYKGHYGYILQREGMTTHLSYVNSPENKMPSGALQNINIQKLGSFFSTRCSQPLPSGLGYKNSDKSLISLTKAFNECQGAPYQVYSANSPSTKTSFGPIIGFSNSQLIFDVNNLGFPDINRTQFDSFNTFLIGFELNTTLQRINQNISLTTGMYYQQSKFYGNYTRQRSPSVLIEEEFNFDASLIKPTLGLGYRVLDRGIPLTVFAGFNLSIRLNKSSFRQRNQTTTNSITNEIIIESTRETEEWMINSNSFGHWLGIGSQVNVSEKLDLTLQFRFENNGRINVLASRTKSLQFMLGLMFKK